MRIDRSHSGYIPARANQPADVGGAGRAASGRYRFCANVLGLAALLVLGSALAAHAAVGEMIVLKGKATVLRNSQAITVTERIELEHNDIIRTGDGAKVQVNWFGLPGKSNSIVTGNTVLRVRDIARVRKVSPVTLLWGAIRSRITAFFPTRPFIGTPTAVVGIKGTDFIVYVKREEATEFIGVAGLIEGQSTSNPDHAIRIGKRQWGEIVRGEKPKAPIRVPDDVWAEARNTFNFPGVTGFGGDE